MNRYLYIFIISMLASAESEAQQKTTLGDEVPRLVVAITVDQLRSSHLEEFLPIYGQDGLRRLLTEGLVYNCASYPFSPVDNASAMACLSTGTTPYYNSVPSSEWISRSTLRPVHAGQSENSTEPGAENLMTSTLGDELKIATGGIAKVYAIAKDMNAAIMAAGHAADAALWLNSDQQWTTSGYYQEKNQIWLDSFNKYVSSTATSGKLDDNMDVTSLALRCATYNTIGQDNVTDLLSVEYSITPNDDHYTVGEQYRALDRDISRLMTELEKQVGKYKILFVFSSTGHYDQITEDDKRYRIPTGTFFINRSAGLLNMYLSAIWGQGQYVAAYRDNEIYLDHKFIEQKHIQMNDVLTRSREMLMLSDGVREVYTSLSLHTSVDKGTQLIRNGHSMTTSGDIIVEIAPGWKLLNEDNQQYKHWRADCVLFPVIFLGGNITHKVVTTTVTTDQITPTICKSIRIRAPNACKSAPLY